MYAIQICFAYEDGELSLEELIVDGTEVLNEEKRNQDFEEFASFSPLDNLDFWERLVERIKKHIGVNDARLAFDVDGLPDLCDLVFGVDYNEITGCDEDVAQLRKLVSEHIKPAAESGWAYAQKLVGDFLCFRWKYGKAVKWYRKAAKHGLTKDLIFHVRITEVSSATFISCCKDAMIHGDLFAQSVLSVSYLSGDYVKKDEARALELAEDILTNLKLCSGFYAARSTAAWVCGQCHELGLCMAVDLQKAFLFYQTAFKFNQMARYEEKFPVTAYDLARCYDCGIGTAKNAPLALKYYREAKTPDAEYALGHFYENGIGTKIDVAMAISCYYFSAGWGNSDAMEALARCYENGIGVEPDKKQAAHWREKAAISRNAGDNAQ